MAKIPFKTFVNRLRQRVMTNTPTHHNKEVELTPSALSSPRYISYRVMGMKNGEKVGQFSVFRDVYFSKRELLHNIADVYDPDMAKDIASKLARYAEKREYGLYSVGYLLLNKEARAFEAARRTILAVLEKQSNKIVKPAVITFSVEPQDVDVSHEVLARFYRSLGATTESYYGSRYGYLILT